MIVVIETPVTLLIDGEGVAVAEMRAGASVLVDSDSDAIVYAAIKSGGEVFDDSIEYAQARIEVKRSGVRIIVKTKQQVDAD